MANKVDLIANDQVQTKINKLEDLAPNIVPISALNNTNINLLKHVIINNLTNFTKASFTIPISGNSASFLSWFFNHAEIHSIKYSGNVINVFFESLPSFTNKIKYRVEQLGGTFNS